MQISDNTLTILRNFSTINPSVVFKPGHVIRTISPQKTVMAMATISDEIPSDACVYDTSKFLSLLGLYENPDVKFNEKDFLISEGKRKTRYVFADPSMVISPPEKEIKIPSEDVKVSLKWDDIQSVIKASGVLQLPEIAFIGDAGTCYLRAINSADKGSDSFGIELGETEDTFQLIIKTENLKLLPMDYDVTISSKGISCFAGKDIKYFIAIESKSTYTKA